MQVCSLHSKHEDSGTIGGGEPLHHTPPPKPTKSSYVQMLKSLTRLIEFCINYVPEIRMTQNNKFQITEVRKH